MARALRSDDGKYPTVKPAPQLDGTSRRTLEFRATAPDPEDPFDLFHMVLQDADQSKLSDAVEEVVRRLKLPEWRESWLYDPLEEVWQVTVNQAKTRE